MKQEYVFAVAGLITRDLLLPEICSGTRKPEEVAIIVAMPETTVDKNRSSILGQDDIGTTGQVFSVKAEPEALAVQQLSYDNFGLCILAADAGHHPASRLLVDNVCQQTSSAGKISAGPLLHPLREAGNHRHRNRISELAVCLGR